MLSKFALGRGELKINTLAFLWKAAFHRKAALLVLGISFLINIPTISAQENVPLSQEEAAEQLADRQPADDSLRIVEQSRIDEQSLIFGEDTPVAQVSGPSVWSVIRMILALALVAAAIYGIVFLFRKATKQTPNTDPYLKILANTHLGANRYAHIISVGAKAWLVGSSEGGVNLISEIEDKEIIDAMLLDDSRKIEQAPGRLADFMSMLRRLGVRAQTNTPGADDIRKRRERLKGL